MFGTFGVEELVLQGKAREIERGITRRRDRELASCEPPKRRSRAKDLGLRKVAWRTPAAGDAMVLSVGYDHV
jgi:hypothetical protein